MGVTTGCGCKEVYRLPHTTYPYSSCICSFLQQHPYFLFITKWCKLEMTHSVNPVLCSVQLSRVLILAKPAASL